MTDPKCYEPNIDTGEIISTYSTEVRVAAGNDFPMN